MDNNTFLSYENQPYFETVQNASNDLKISTHNILDRSYLREKASKRGKIREFTIKSQQNAKWTFRSFADQETSMVLTYPLDFLPNLDGRKIKQHLNRFLKKLRRIYSYLTYNWVLEFTKNQNPHFHVTTNIKPNDIKEFRLEVRQIWYDIVGTNNPHHLQQGVNQCDYIRSKGGVATYISGYLSKENQKKVPEQFKHTVGRFWGTSKAGKVEVRNVYQLPSVTFEDDKLRVFKACARPASKYRSKLHKKLTYQSKQKAISKVLAWLMCVKLVGIINPVMLPYLKIKLGIFRYRHYNTRRKAGNGVYWGNGQELLEKVTLSYQKATYQDLVPF